MKHETKCERIAESLIPYLDGRATSAERREVEAHAATCVECKNRIAEFRRVSIALDELPVMEPSAAFDARVRRRIADEPRVRWFGWLVPTPRLAFSLAFLVVLSVWTVRFEPSVAVSQATANAAQSEQDFRLIKDLDVLENYDVVKNFDALSELPVAEKSQTQSDRDQNKETNGRI
jgi:anti-sigma factor RsiW